MAYKPGCNIFLLLNQIEFHSPLNNKRRRWNFLSSSEDENVSNFLFFLFYASDHSCRFFMKIWVHRWYFYRIESSTTSIFMHFSTLIIKFFLHFMSYRKVWRGNEGECEGAWNFNNQYNTTMGINDNLLSSLGAATYK